MDRNAIIREWFYRLPKGYAEAPYSKEEMNVLHEILSENGLNGSIFVNEVDQLDQAFHDAKPVKDLEENEEVTTQSNKLFPFEELKPEFADMITKANKTDDWDDFINALPGGKSVEKVKDIINKLTSSEMKNFVNGMSSIDSVKELKSETPDKSSGIEKVIFDEEPAGVGRGELWLAWKVKGKVKISGPGLSYDVALEPNIVSGLGGRNYEVKAYHSKKNTKKPFRLGTHGILGRFKFWKNMLDTAILIEQLENFIDQDNEGMAKLGELVGELNESNLRLAISKGEIGQARVNKLLDFYEEANRYSKTIEKPNTYDIIQVKSSVPGNPSKYYSIDPSALEDILGKKIPNPVSIDDDKNKLKLTQKLLANPYVRNPERLQDDINEAIEKVTDAYKTELSAGFLVFREGGINISDGAELRRVQDLRKDMSEPRNVLTLSMGRMYVKELTEDGE